MMKSAIPRTMVPRRNGAALRSMILQSISISMSMSTSTTTASHRTSITKHHWAMKRQRTTSCLPKVPQARYSSLPKRSWNSTDKTMHPRLFSSMPTDDDDNDDDDNYNGDTIRMASPPTSSSPQHSIRHCDTCTCFADGDGNGDGNGNGSDPPAPIVDSSTDASTTVYPCGSLQHEDNFPLRLPPPLPEPVYSVHKRILPSTSSVALNSTTGRRQLLEALQEESAESYWALMEQFVNQSDPAFCGVTTLQMVLNAMCVDPDVRWKGGWRFYGSEDVVLGRCCLSSERIRRVGVTLEEFRSLARCHGLEVELKRPRAPSKILQLLDEEVESSSTATTPTSRYSYRLTYTLDDFSKDIQQTLATRDSKSILVTSFSRASLGQTGDGHFSPIAAYHSPTDQVLILDVARFKYTPYWVPVNDLFVAMQPEDPATQRARGWFVLHPPTNHSCLHGTKEVRRPAEVVPLAEDGEVCPMGRVKVEYCQVADPGR